MKFEPTEVKRTLELIKPEGSLCEVRIIDSKKKIHSGYFEDHTTLINALSNLHINTNCNVYLILNTIDESCFSREQRNKFVLGSNTTADTDITSCQWFFCDIDPIRATGISSTDAELEHAKIIAKKVASYLDSLGFKKPIVAMSGNGYHLLFKIQLDNTKENAELIKSCLEVLSDLFSDDVAKIDTVNFNASRVCKLYGTRAEKGSDNPERPHRMSRLVSVPEMLEVNSKEQLELLSNQLPKVNQEEVRKRKKKNYKSAFNLDDFLYQNGISFKIANGNGRDGSKIYRLDECPFDSNHTDGDAKLFSFPDGAIAFKCHHNSCSCYRWQDVRAKFDENYNPDNDYSWNNSKSRASESGFDSDRDEIPFDIDSINSISADVIDLDAIEEPITIVKDLLCEGLFLLNAPAKNGKSRLVLQLLIDICRGNKFLDYFDTNRCECLYLALEDDYELDFKKRLKEFIGYSKIPQGLHVLTKTNFPKNKDNQQIRDTPKLGKSGGLSELIRREKEKYPGILFVAVDVFGTIRSEKQHKDFTLDERADVEELLNLASDLRVCILCSHHVAKGSINTFKTSDSATGSGAGSYAISGSVIGELSLVRDKDRNFATLRGEGRRTPATALYLRDSYPRWEYVSTLAEHQKQMKDEEESEEGLAIVETARYLISRDSEWKGTAREFQRENESNTDLPPLPKAVNRNSFTPLVLHQLKMNGINYKQLKNGTAPVRHQLSKLSTSSEDDFQDVAVSPDEFNKELVEIF